MENSNNNKSKKQQLQSVRGMNDILPSEAFYWEVLENIVKNLLLSHAYSPIRLPIVEPTPLFKRAIGEITDIVEKEMYSFVDSLNGENLTLRPEGTAGCVRAVIQHHLATQQNQKLFYIGPMFRHERPQKGRYRQFTQIGVETFGYDDANIELELILIGAKLWKALGLQDNIRLEINTLGELHERKNFRENLIKFFEIPQNLEIIKQDADAFRRLYTNPLRILDSKNPQIGELCQSPQMPKLFDFLGENSQTQFENLQNGLQKLGIPFSVNSRLVRGLDYYNRTVFEWITNDLGTQGTVCAGGRYDSLVEQLGGKATTACGFAMGVERLIALLMDKDKQNSKNNFGNLVENLQRPDVFVMYDKNCQDSEILAMQIAENLREIKNLKVLVNFGGGSFKSQFKKADASKAKFAIIIGESEVANNVVQIKNLQTQQQSQILISEICNYEF